MAKLVRFAGYDQTEDQNAPGRAVRAYKLFLSGFDTFEVARIMRISEAYSLKLVSVGRSHMLGLPVPYAEAGR